MKPLRKIVIVGGGAGGLELATKLGRKLGRRGKAHVTLIDRNTTHIWKPLLHEIAVGTLDEGVDAVSYRAQAFTYGFHFRIGSMTALDAATGEEVPAVVIAIGEFINTIIQFTIVAFAIFLVVKAINRLKRRQVEEKEPAAVTPEDVLLLREIRDALKK